MAIVNLIPSQGRLQVKTWASAKGNNDRIVTCDTGYNGLSSVTIKKLTVTVNTTLPSGKTSSGEISRGTYIKVNNGYEADDFYYLAQANAGTYSVTSYGTHTVNGYYYVSVPQGTITLSTTKPSNVNSSGTCNRGTYIKVGAGYYNSDLYYLAEGTSGTYTITAAGTYNVADKTYVTVSAGSVGVATALTSGEGISGKVGTNSYVKIAPGYYSSKIIYLATSPNAVFGQTTATVTKSNGNITFTRAVNTAGWVSGSVTGTWQFPTRKTATTWPVVGGSNSVILTQGTYLSGDQTLRFVRVYNLSPGNVKKNVTVTIGDNGSFGRITSVAGTY